MARQCPTCGALNDDSLGFCSSCGEAIHPDVKLAMDLKNYNKVQSQASSRRMDDGDDYVPPSASQKKKEKKSAAPWIILGIIVVAVVLWLVLK